MSESQDGQDAASPVRAKPLVIKITQKDGVTVVSPQSSVDYYHLTELKEQIAAVVDGGCANVVIDLSHALYLASTTVGVLIGQKAKATQKKGDVRLCHVAPGLWNMFVHLGIESVFERFGTVEQAVQSFQ